MQMMKKENLGLNLEMKMQIRQIQILKKKVMIILIKII